jgi:hypothetical protein
VTLVTLSEVQIGCGFDGEATAEVTSAEPESYRWISLDRADHDTPCFENEEGDVVIRKIALSSGVFDSGSRAIGCSVEQSALPMNENLIDEALMELTDSGF